MAAGILPSPGSEYGPCVAECQHRDCAASRRMSEAVCRYCDKTIGYDRRFYEDEDGLMHAVCHEESIEREASHA